MLQLANNYLVCGLPGAGKSEFAKALSRKLGFGFVDLDQEIQNEAKMTISQYVEKHGWDAFRQFEFDVLQTFAAVHSHVIALGGGALEYQQSREFCEDLGELVYIEVSPGIVASRIYNDPDKLRARPYFKEAVSIEDAPKRLQHVKGLLEELQKKRQSDYLQAKYCLNDEYASADELARQLVLNIESQQSAKEDN